MKDRIEGKNIYIRKLRLKDAEDIYKNINDRQIVKFLTRVPWPYYRHHATEFIKDTFSKRRKGESYPFGICLKGEDRVIGVVDIFKIDHRHRNAEIGYWLGRKYWGKGIMSEAVKLIEGFAFRELKLHRIRADAFEHNRASCRVLEKRGFKKEGFMRDAVKARGRYKCLHVYSKLAG